jgi:pimeloyl-ACP methyl ester carboxylesterase
MNCRYVDTSRGQLHYRTAGDGDPLVLLHWTPWSSRQYLPVFPLFVDLGYAPIAFDMMGFGRSDARDGDWLIGDFADNIAEAMASLGLGPAALLGGHVAAEVAAEVAVENPDLVRLLILDGSPVWSRKEREDVLAGASADPPEWSEDGAHFAWAWQRTVWLKRIWDPAFELSDDTARQLFWDTVDFLETGLDQSGATALVEYDMAATLKKVSIPLLALTAETDPVRSSFERVLEIVPTACGHCFSKSHPIHHPERAGEYVDVVHQFMTTLSTRNSQT